MRGKFITIEGPEGCGKTTQSNILVQHIKEQGYEVILTREPGGTRIGEVIRALVLDAKYEEMVPLTELLLMAASRSQHVLEKIRPGLKEGKMVICSRFSDATIAYQGCGRGFDIDLLKRINRIATGGLAPDLTLVIDIDVTTGLRRAFGVEKAEARSGEGDRLESEDIGFHERVRQGYLDLAHKEPERVKVIGGSGTIDEVSAAIRKAVDAVVRITQ
ncbi:MAG: dTMP kinase [Candidatus Aureabacteria bacterium]|nr:dTMP kinase [Candidatus Auribacterota bacterium]